jgi:hypothetical protein
MTIKGRMLTMKEMVMMLTRMLTRTGMVMVMRMVTRMRARMLVKTVTMVMLDLLSARAPGRSSLSGR